jgi:hypothetical protein
MRYYRSRSPGADNGFAGHRDVHDLTIDDASLDLRGWRENKRDPEIASALERTREFGQHIVHRTACEYLEFGGIRRSRQSQYDGETDCDRDSRQMEQSSTAARFHGPILRPTTN